MRRASIHPAVAETGDPLPVCADCHSAHEIQRTDESDFRLHIMDQCGHCHEEITESYFETFHGKVSRLGYEKAAKCYDCHGSHDILPVANPDSRLSRDNIVETCGACHPGSHRRFAGYLTHATHHDPDRYPFLFITFWAMTALLLGTFTVSGLHTLLWLPRSLKYRRQMLALTTDGGGQPYVRRFRGYERNLHLMVIFSFLGLAATGMILKFSYTGWAQYASAVFGGFEATGWIHRFCALITFSYFGLHVRDLIRKKRASGKSWKGFILDADSMMFNKGDLRELIGSLKWFVGKGPRPQYGRWTYWEKFDYFAVFWGVGVIGSTGLILWFPELFTRLYARLGSERRHHNPLRRSPARHRLHLHHPLLQHTLPAGEVPDRYGGGSRAACRSRSSSTIARVSISSSSKRAVWKSFSCRHPPRQRERSGAGSDTRLL